MPSAEDSYCEASVLGEFNHGSVLLFLTDHDHMVALLAALRGEIKCI
jgi:hypothetical protein